MIHFWQKRWFLCVLLGISLLLILIWGVLAHGIWFRYFDLHSGEIKHRTELFGILLDERIESTPYAELLQRENLVKKPPRWVLDFSCSFTQWLFQGEVSPHHLYHGVITETEEFAECLSMRHFSNAEQRELILWEQFALEALPYTHRLVLSSRLIDP